MDLLTDALTQGIAPAIVVAIYLIITKVIDNKRESEQIKLNANITNSINTISNFIIELTKNIIEKDRNKCKNAIETSMNASAFNLVQFVSNTVLNNHLIANKKNILENIHSIVNSEFYEVYGILNAYIIDNEHVSEYMDKTWIKEIEEDMISILYNNEFTNDMKVLSFVNKVNARFQHYTTYLLNNVLK